MITRRHALLFAAAALPLAVGAFLLVYFWQALFPDGPGPEAELGRLPPTVIVEATYPGADVQVVGDVVAAPIEQQVNGVEGMRYMTSHCGNDGSYTLTVTFEPGTDLNVAQVLVQNRVSLAHPVLPDLVNRTGVTVKKISPGLLLLITLSSPNGRYSTQFLGNYAAQRLTDELARLPGVGEVAGFGQHDYSLRVWFDPEKLAAHQLTVAEAVRALRKHNVQVAEGPLGKPPGGKGQNLPICVNLLGRLADAGQLEDLVLKADGKGRGVRLKDVARIELGATHPDSSVLRDGKPVVALGIYPLPGARPQEVSAAVRDKLAELRPKHPEGVTVDVAFDFAPNLEAPNRPETPEHLLLDVQLPDAASVERVVEVLKRCGAILRETAGVRDVLALTDNPFDRVRERACLLARLAPADGERASRERIIRTIRGQFSKQIEEAVVRLRDLAGLSRFPRCGYPIDLALHGPEADQVRQWADTLAERLVRTGKLTDVRASRPPGPRLQVDIDVAALKAHGVSAVEANKVLRIFGPRALDVNPLGRNGGASVRNGKGEMIPLAKLVKVRQIEGGVADRFNGRPMVAVRANPASGVSLAEARALCETTAEAVRKELRLPAEYRLTWLQALPAPP
jgi:multidrug efflux pump subunit AcrB